MTPPGVSDSPCPIHSALKAVAGLGSGNYNNPHLAWGGGAQVHLGPHLGTPLAEDAAIDVLIIAYTTVSDLSVLFMSFNRLSSCNDNKYMSVSCMYSKLQR